MIIYSVLIMSDGTPTVLPFSTKERALSAISHLRDKAIKDKYFAAVLEDGYVLFDRDQRHHFSISDYDYEVRLLEHQLDSAIGLDVEQ